MKRGQAFGLSVISFAFFMLLFGIGYETIENTDPVMLLVFFLFGVFIFIGGGE